MKAAIYEKQGFKVKIYPMTRGGFTLCYKGPNGRKRESAPTDVAARHRANDILKQLCAARSDLLGLSIEEVAEYRAVRTLLGDKSLRAAAEFYVNQYSPCKKFLLTDPIEGFLAEKARTGVSARHLSTLQQHLNKFATWFKGTSLTDISLPFLNRYLHLCGSPKTWMNHRITLITFFKWCRKHRFVADKETVAEQTDAPIIPGADPGILTPGELAGLLAVVDDPQLKLFIAIGAFAGLRPSEIERLRWSDIRGGTITLGRDITKTKRRRVVPITDNLRVWLGADNPVVTDIPVVGTRMHRKLEQACKAAGLQWKHNALRHSSISYAMALTKDAAAVAEAHGHSVSRLQESYKANVTETDAREWFATTP